MMRLELTEQEYTLVLRTLILAHSNTRMVPEQENYRILQTVLRKMREQDQREGAGHPKEVKDDWYSKAYKFPSVK